MVMNYDDQERISKLLHAKRCELWPECGCHVTLVYWQDKLEHDYKGWSDELLRWAETSIFINLSCVASRCPDRKIKTWAMMQLLDPFWDRQKRGGDDEFIERRREQLKAQG